MPSIMSHAVFASSLGAAGSPGARMPVRYWAALAVVAALPDLDVVVYPLGLNAPHILGHRGLTHSLPFAAVFAALVVRLRVSRRASGARRGRGSGLVFFAAMASHGVLDAMTNGGQGIAFFAPFSDARWHFPWQPILVSPIGVGAFLSELRPARAAERDALAVAAVGAGRAGRAAGAAAAPAGPEPIAA